MLTSWRDCRSSTISKLEVDIAKSTAFLKQKGMRVHLGGIGKGYAVDRAAAILRGRGFNDFMIQSGGDLYVAGQRGDRPWRAGIQDPRGPEGSSFAAMDLTDSAFTTSGDYERFFMKDGRRYHHIIDPDTGEPAHGSRSVTIVARTATLADALDTGIFILGPEKGMALIERLNGVEGVIVTSSNNVLVSSGLAQRLVVRSPPTDAPDPLQARRDFDAITTADCRPIVAIGLVASSDRRSRTSARVHRGTSPSSTNSSVRSRTGVDGARTISSVQQTSSPTPSASRPRRS